jgi:hypothetical protein
VRRLSSERMLAVALIVFVLLVSACTVVSVIALHRTTELAQPSDGEVIGRLQRGVRVMSPRQARDIIGTMTRKAARH